jgi:hypothetical protein
MPQQYKIGQHSTTVSGSLKDNNLSVVYHSTDVVKVTPTKIILNTGGWYTVTTKNRMNQTSNQFNIGFYVYQKNCNWFVTYLGKTTEFKKSKITLTR